MARTKLDGPNAMGRVSPKTSRDSKPKEYGKSLNTALSANETKEPERGEVSNDGSFSVSAPREDEELSMTKQRVVGKPNNINKIIILCRHLPYYHHSIIISKCIQKCYETILMALFIY